MMLQAPLASAWMLPHRPCPWVLNLFLGASPKIRAAFCPFFRRPLRSDSQPYSRAALPLSSSGAFAAFEISSASARARAKVSSS